MRTPAMKFLIACLIISISLGGMALAEDVYGRATDPSHIGVGARPLGMGKAYVALAEDGNSIFTNPAGLGKVNEVLLSSMYSNLMEEVNYMVGSFTYPVGTGTLAFGYLGSTVAGIDLYSVSNEGTIEALGQSDYNNYVLYLSYGVRLEDINPDIMLGVNLKSFGKSFTGPTELISEGNGTGMNMDLGILYQPNDWFTFGLTQQNILDSGKMEFSNGIKEDIAGLTKFGFNMNLMGKYGYIKAPYKLNLAADVDIDTRNERENTMHIGAELWPMQMLALRVGIDQDSVPGSVVSNLTAGVGLRIGNISFDYAYHAYYDIPENSTNYFSISMVGPFEQRKPRNKFVAKLEKPKDNIVTHEDKVELKGSIEDLRPGDTVEINGKRVHVDEDGNFKASLIIDSFGAKRVMVEAKDAQGHKATFKRDIFKLASFNDVKEDHWAKRSIELLATAGLVKGYPNGKFQPEKTLTRAELSTLLVKAKGLAVPSKASRIFGDVPTDHWAASYIEAAVEAGLVKGYPDKTFRPNSRIKKSEGVTVMARLEGLDEIAQDLIEDVEDSRFGDIADSWAAGYVMAADDAGLLDYIEESTKFNPNSGLTRAEAVEMLSRTTLGDDKIRALLDTSKNDDVAAALLR